MFVRHDEAVGFEHNARGRGTALPRHRIRTEEAYVFDDVDPGHALQNRERVARLHRSTPWPTVAVRAADERVEVVAETLEGLGADAVDIGARPRSQLRHDRDASIHRRFD